MHKQRCGECQSQSLNTKASTYPQPFYLLEGLIHPNFNDIFWKLLSVSWSEWYFNIFSMWYCPWEHIPLCELEYPWIQRQWSEWLRAMLTKLPEEKLQLYLWLCCSRGCNYTNPSELLFLSLTLFTWCVSLAGLKNYLENERARDSGEHRRNNKVTARVGVYSTMSQCISAVFVPLFYHWFSPPTFFLTVQN